MLPYFLLVLIPFLCSYVAITRSASSRRSLCIGSGRLDVIREHNLALPVFFALLFLMLACRGIEVGSDTRQYERIVQEHAEEAFGFSNLWKPESLFRLFNRVVWWVTDNFQLYLMITSAMIIVPLAMLYGEDRRYSFMKIVIFINMSTFVMMFSGIRQMLAIVLGIVAYMCVRRKRLVWFLVVSVLALGFHHSAFMILLMYPVYHLRLKKKHLWFILPMIMIVFVFNRQIFGVLNLLLISFDESYSALQTSSIGAYSSLIMFAAFAVFTYIVADESQMDEEMYGLRNLLLLAVVLQCFAPLHSLAMRMNYYYIIFIPITMAKAATIPKPNLKQVSRIAVLVITVFFLLYFVMTIYTGYVSGKSALGTVPYIPFWQG